MSDDIIDQYLAALRARLRTPDAALVLAETEDHLRDAVAAGLAAGLSEREAQQTAIAAFGSVRTVVRAHRTRYGKAVLAENVVMANLKLACICLYVAATGVLALFQDLAVSRAVVAEAPTGTRYSLSNCLYWMRDNPGAHTCAQAAMLEGSGDATSSRWESAARSSARCCSRGTSWCATSSASAASRWPRCCQASRSPRSR